MLKGLFSLALFCVTLLINGQDAHPDLGLNGKITWLSDSVIRVEYDWSADSQLLDWAPTKGSKLVLSDSAVTISDGDAAVRSMVWKQLIKCSRIYAEEAKSLNSEVAHLNFITNVLGWTGFNYNPEGIVGALYKENGNFWLESGTSTSLGGAAIQTGSGYKIDFNISAGQISSLSSSDNVEHKKDLISPPSNERQVALGGWGGDTEWGKLIIEGVITPPYKVPDGWINIRSIGKTFAPVIEVAGSPVIEWIFDDSTFASAKMPSKDYGSIGFRHNLLKVTPWSALKGINVGYDAADEGYGGFSIVSPQNVTGFDNLNLAKDSLQYLCISYNPLIEIDLRELGALRFIEALDCKNLIDAKLGTHPVLERICFENCNLDSLDLSGCSGLEDLRTSRNNLSIIKWATIGSVLWHLCVRSNPLLTENIPDLRQFPLLEELLLWDSNQKGSFFCHSEVIRRIDAFGNHYTSADVSGCTELREFSLSGSHLDSINLGTADRLNYVRLVDCSLTELQVDYIAKTLDDAGLSDGHLELKGNSGPTSNGSVNLENLKSKGWTLSFEPLTEIPDIDNETGPLKIIVRNNNISITADNELISGRADLYNLQGVLLASRIIENDNIEFNTSDFSTGIYIVMLSRGEKRKAAKFYIGETARR